MSEYTVAEIAKLLLEITTRSLFWTNWESVVRAILGELLTEVNSESIEAKLAEIANSTEYAQMVAETPRVKKKETWKKLWSLIPWRGQDGRDAWYHIARFFLGQSRDSYVDISRINSEIQ